MSEGPHIGVRGFFFFLYCADYIERKTTPGGFTMKRNELHENTKDFQRLVELGLGWIFGYRETRQCRGIKRKIKKKKKGARLAIGPLVGLFATDHFERDRNFKDSPGPSLYLLSPPPPPPPPPPPASLYSPFWLSFLSRISEMYRQG